MAAASRAQNPVSPRTSAEQRGRGPALDARLIEVPVAQVFPEGPAPSSPQACFQPRICSKVSSFETNLSRRPATTPTTPTPARRHPTVRSPVHGSRFAAASSSMDGAGSVSIGGVEVKPSQGTSSNSPSGMSRRPRHSVPTPECPPVWEQCLSASVNTMHPPTRKSQGLVNEEPVVESVEDWQKLSAAAAQLDEQTEELKRLSDEFRAKVMQSEVPSLVDPICRGGGSSTPIIPLPRRENASPLVSAVRTDVDTASPVNLGVLRSPSQASSLSVAASPGGIRFDGTGGGHSGGEISSRCGGGTGGTGGGVGASNGWGEGGPKSCAQAAKVHSSLLRGMQEAGWRPGETITSPTVQAAVLRAVRRHWNSQQADEDEASPGWAGNSEEAYIALAGLVWCLGGGDGCEGSEANNRIHA
eukprot:TRINITY_DN23803_c0_g1_i2.p1 TRINITY_DN23803_c0_g1~~TRINITY_DN23803_c0_g1_i2.p1  ORF type:complete len:473 (+),score=60.97 TRINITY_DN23803_c0_g1_i2:175-1419(+)